MRLAYWLPTGNIFFRSLHSIQQQQHHHSIYRLLSLDAFPCPACLTCWLAKASGEGRSAVSNEGINTSVGNSILFQENTHCLVA
jgi:hypothetical protein